MRTILRAILAFALLLGSGAADWAPGQEPAHEACCCGTPAGVEDSCPCPKPEGNRAPSSSLCANRTISVALQAVRRSQGQRRIEPRPEPTTWAKAVDVPVLAGTPAAARGRDPDLGRHLARLHTLLI